ncbi:MAG: hypothetical protein IPM24_26315 [Bryobacterales bacterium]|nr:hypothetical protein [Bryobacterales bacterium]
MAAFDRVIVDGAVNGAGWLTRFTSTLSIWWDTWIIDGAIRLDGFLGEAGRLPGAAVADRAGAVLRAVRPHRGAAVLRLLRGEVIMDQHLLSIVLFTPWPGLLVLFIPARRRT